MNRKEKRDLKNANHRRNEIRRKEKKFFRFKPGYRQMDGLIIIDEIGVHSWDGLQHAAEWFSETIKARSSMTSRSFMETMGIDNELKNEIFRPTVSVSFGKLWLPGQE